MTDKQADKVKHLNENFLPKVGVLSIFSAFVFIGLGLAPIVQLLIPDEFVYWVITLILGTAFGLIACGALYVSEQLREDEGDQ